MKKLNILRLLSTVAIAAAGVFGLASVKEGKKVEVAEAANTNISSVTYKYRFTVPHDFGQSMDNKIFLHAWGSNGHDTSWNKDSFLVLSDFSYNENDERVYVLGVNYTYTGFIIIRWNDNPDGCKTQDINVGSNTAWSWDGVNGHSASAWTPKDQTYYFYDYNNWFPTSNSLKVYAWQSSGKYQNAAYPGELITTVESNSSGQVYKITLDCAFDEMILSTSDKSSGDQWINKNRGETFCWWNDESATWSNDFDWIKAHDWVYNTMHVRDISTSATTDTSACKGSTGYYQKAKTAYNSFTAAIKTKISQDECYGIASARLAAWARANGETATDNAGTIVFGAPHSIILNSVIGNSNTLMIILIVSFVGAGAIAGYFFIRKRKEN